MAVDKQSLATTGVHTDTDNDLKTNILKFGDFKVDEWGSEGL